MTCFRTNTKNISWKMCYSWFRLYFFCPSVLAIQKTYRKNASDFYLGKQELQTSLEVSYKNFANNGLYWLQFLNLWCAMTKHNSSFLFKVFAVSSIHLQIHTSLLVGLHSLFDSDIRICNLDFMLSCCNLIFLFFFF